MKVLATSDWHIGKVFHDTDLTNDHKHYLDWLTATVNERQPDILLVGGDVFQNGSPSALAQEMYYNFLSDVTEANKNMTVVIIAGNHDNPDRLTAAESLLKRNNILVRGRVKRVWQTDDDKKGHWAFTYDDLLIPVTTASGEKAVVLAIPYVNPNDTPNGTTYSEVMHNIMAELMSRAKALGDSQTSTIMLAHMYATGSEIAENSSEHIIGGQESVNLDDLNNVHPTLFVSGHIHKRQAIWGTAWARYCGSALPMSVAEKDNKHGADFYTLKDGKIAAQPEFIEFKPLRSILSLPSGADKSFKGIIDELKALPKVDPAHPETMSFVFVTLQREDNLLDNRNKLEAEIRKHHIVLAGLSQEERVTVFDANGDAHEEVSSIDKIKIDPLDTISKVFVNKYGSQMSDEQLQLAKQAISEAANALSNNKIQ